MIDQKVLIVDDNIDRAHQISAILVEAGFRSSSIFSCVSVSSAIKYLLANRVDFLVVDISIPDMDGEHPLPDGGVRLVRRIEELSPPIIPPRSIIAITAHEESRRITHLEFNSRLVSVLNAEVGSSEWKSYLKNFALRLIESSQKNEMSRADICFLTALRAPELNAVIDLPINWGMRSIAPFLANQSSGELDVSGNLLSVEAFTYDKMGLVPMSYLTAAVIESYRPKLLILTGICGGIPDSVNLGDVVVAENSWNWQSGKIKNSDMLIDGDAVQASPDIISIAKHVGASQNARLELMKSGQHIQSVKDRLPVVHVGPMASGSTVVADAPTKLLIQDQNRKVLALDMEAFAFYSASRFSSIGQTKLICIKGVCDKADSSKADEIQIMCSQRSALVASKIVESYFGTLIS